MKLRRGLLVVAAVAVVSLLGAAPALAAQTIQVSTSGNDVAGCGQGANTPCATIQGALDTSPAANGDTIQVGPGVYNETSTLNVDKDVTIIGAGDNPNTGGTTLLLPSVSTGLQPDGAPNPSTGSPPDYAVAFIGSAGSGATIEDLTLNGADDGNPGQTTGGNYPFVGLDVYDASATVNGVQITGIQTYPMGGAQYTTALQANDDNNNAQSLTVENSNINAYQKAGMAFWGSGLTANVSGTSVTGVGPTPTLAQDGIEYLKGASGAVTGDTVTGNECNEPGGVCGPDQATQAQAIGVLLYGSGPVTVSGSTINNNDLGIFYGYPSSGKATISNNIIRGDRYEGLDLGQGTSTVTGNAISDSNFGVQVYSYGGSGPGEDTANAVANLTGNTITGNQTGIEAGDDTPSSPAVFPVITAHRNDISGNSTSGFANDVQKPQSATYNYWGCQAGPGHQGCDGPTGAFAALVSTRPFLGSLAPFPPGIRAAFGAVSIPVGGTTSLTFTITNPNVGSKLTGIGFSDSLPAGLRVASPNGLAGSCGSGTVTAAAGSSTISLAGGSLSADSICTISVKVTARTTGRKVDTTGPVTSNEGGNGGRASASLGVVGAPRISITDPRDHATYRFGAHVKANYSCHDAPGGPGISKCSGTVRNGAPINTSVAGAHRFTVTATSHDGLTVTRTVRYTVLPDNRFQASDVHPGGAGSVSFDLTAPGPGKLSVVAIPERGQGAGSGAYGKGTGEVQAGRSTFVVRPDAHGRALLREHPHGLRIILQITYTPRGGHPRTVTRPGHYGVRVS